MRRAATALPTVRAYRATDEAALLRVWNAALALDPISPVMSGKR
jgi:hypothetical protein